MSIQVGPANENLIAQLFENDGDTNERCQNCIKLCASGYQMTKEDLICLGSQLDLYTSTDKHEIELIRLHIQHYHQYVKRHNEYPSLYFPEVLFGPTSLEFFLSLFKQSLTADEILCYKKGIEITRQNQTLSHGFEEEGYLGWHPKSVRRAFKKLSKQLSIDDLSNNTVFDENTDSFKQDSQNAKLKQNTQTLFKSFSENFKSLNIRNLNYCKEKLKLGEPLPFMLAGDGHAIGVMLYKDYMVYVNTGNRGKCRLLNASGLWIFNIADGKNQPLLEMLLKSNLRKINDIESFIEDLTKNKWLSKAYFKHIEAQNTYDCSWRAFKLLFPTALSLDFLPEIRKRKKHLIESIVLSAVEKLITVGCHSATLFRAVNENEHSIWYLTNAFKPEHLSFTKSFEKASNLFEEYYINYLISELNCALNISRADHNMGPDCDKGLLIRCYKKLQQKESTQSKITKLKLDEQIKQLDPQATKQHSMI